MQWIAGGTINVQIRGDFNSNTEYVDIFLNAQNLGRCTPTGIDQCDVNFYDCGFFNVVPPNTTGNLRIHSSDGVNLNGDCSFAMKVRATFSRN